MTDSSPYNWQDSRGDPWSVTVEASRITLTSEQDEIISLPREVWSRDIYVAAHAGGYIVRFETFDHSVGFLVSGEQAAPLLDLIGYNDRDDEADERAQEADEPRASRTELLWPKVSPLAVWALICAAPSFVPMLGLPFAVASMLLLLQHARTVRRSAAWRHSHLMCLFAVAFLVLGLPVSGLAWLAKGRVVVSPAEPEIDGPPAYDFDTQSDRSDGGDAPAEAQSLQRAGFFDEEHNWGLIGAALVVVLLSLTVHEGAHAISAWWLGDDFARRLGRVTLNPLVHIDPIGTVLLPLILFLAGVGVFGWAKPVPVQTERLPNPRRAHIWIALAGPGSNLLLAAASLMLLLGIGCAVALAAPSGTITHLTSADYTQTVTASGFPLASLVGPACTVLKLSFLINTFLAFFNLIPIPPLDGSWILEHSFPRTLGPLYARLRPYAILLFLGLIYTDLLYYLLFPAFRALIAGLVLIGAYTPF